MRVKLEPDGVEAAATSTEVAAFLKKPVGWVYENAERLGIPRYKIGNHYRYKLSEVAEWLERRRG